MSSSPRSPEKTKAVSTKSKWTVEEDILLKKAIEMYGSDSWHRVSLFVKTRNGKQCRERWMGQICPKVSKSNWKPAEDRLLFRMQSLHGNKWTFISQFFENRSPICVKNRWYCLQRHRSVSAPSSDTDNESAQERPGRYFRPMEFDDTQVFGPAFVEFTESLTSSILCI